MQLLKYWSKIKELLGTSSTNPKSAVSKRSWVVWNYAKLTHLGDFFSLAFENSEFHQQNDCC